MMNVEMEMINILLAEDDIDDVELFQEALDKVSGNHHLTISSDGTEVMQMLAALGKNLPQVIFLDVNMPKMNGLECLQQIKSLAEVKEIPVIILTTSAARSTIEIAYRLGARLFVEKPSNVNYLKKMLQTVIATDWSKQTCPLPMSQFVYRH